MLQPDIYNNIKKAIENKNYARAVELSKKYLAEEKNSHILVLMVLSLYKRNMLSEAQQAIMDDPNAFADDITDFMLMIKILLKNHEFIKAREIVFSFDGINNEYFSCGMREIKSFEAYVQQHDRDNVLEKARRYYHLSDDKTLSSQRKGFLIGQRLPYDIFLQYSKLVLIDPFVHQVVKSEIIDTLRKIHYQGKMSVYWLHQITKTIDFCNLPSLDKMKSYQYIIRRVTHDFSDNIEKMSLIYNYFYHQSILMYPFNDRIIKDCENWYLLTLQEYLQTEHYKYSDCNGYLKYIIDIKKNFISIT